MTLIVREGLACRRLIKETCAENYFTGKILAVDRFRRIIKEGMAVCPLESNEMANNMFNEIQSFNDGVNLMPE